MLCFLSPTSKSLHHETQNKWNTHPVNNKICATCRDQLERQFVQDVRVLACLTELDHQCLARVLVLLDVSKRGIEVGLQKTFGLGTR